MQGTAFGVMHVDAADRVVAFLEKPADPPCIPGKPDTALASMGLYVFEAKFLYDELRRDAADKESGHDFGHNIIPYLVRHGKAMAHRFPRSCVRNASEHEAYWRDVGTIDAYWEANMDLTSVVPALDIYDTEWPIWTYSELTPRAKFVHDVPGRRGSAVSSLVSGGCIVSGAALSSSLLFTRVHVHSWAVLHESVVLPEVEIGRYARLRRCVVDRGVRIPEGLVVGEDPGLDARRFRRSDNGVVLITQTMLDRLG